MTRSAIAVFILGLTLGSLSPASLSNADTVDRSQDTRTASYQPSHQLALQLIDTLQPLFAGRATFSTDGRWLLVNSNPAVLSEIMGLLPALDHPNRRFTIELSSEPTPTSKLTDTRTYSTEPGYFHQQRFSLQENNTLTLLKEQRAQSTAGSPFLWRQIAAIPTQKEFIQLRIHGAEKQVYLQLVLQTMHNGELINLKSNVSGELNDWIPLTTHPVQSENGYTIQTTARRPNKLYVKITANNP